MVYVLADAAAMCACGALVVDTAHDGRDIHVGRVVLVITGVVVIALSVRLLQTHVYLASRVELDL